MVENKNRSQILILLCVPKSVGGTLNKLSHIFLLAHPAKGDIDSPEIFWMW